MEWLFIRFMVSFSPFSRDKIRILGRLPSVSLETPVTRNNASHREEEAETPFIFASDHLELGPMGYENMTNGIKLQ